MEGCVATAMTTPDTDGWIPWEETEAGTLKPPCLGDLSDGKTIESRYDYDGDRLFAAWSRKVVEAAGRGLGEQTHGVLLHEI